MAGNFRTEMTNWRQKSAKNLRKTQVQFNTAAAREEPEAEAGGERNEAKPDDFPDLLTSALDRDSTSVACFCQQTTALGGFPLSRRVVLAVVCPTFLVAIFANKSQS